jgi:hypothetical protein
MQQEIRLVRLDLRLEMAAIGEQPAVLEVEDQGTSNTAVHTAPQLRPRRSGDPFATGKLQEVAGLYDDPPHEGHGEGRGHTYPRVLGGQEGPTREYGRQLKTSISTSFLTEEG